MLNPIFQTPNNLILAVLKHKLDLPIKVLSQAHWTWDKWAVDFAIIGSSHMITVYYANQCYLQETLACLPLAADQCQHYFPCGNVADYTYANSSYEVRFAVGNHPLTPIPTEAAVLRYTFPRIYQREPITALYWSQRDQKLCWWTLHTYPQPQQDIQVHTFSTLFLEGSS